MSATEELAYTCMILKKSFGTKRADTGSEFANTAEKEKDGEVFSQIATSPITIWTLS